MSKVYRIIFILLIVLTVLFLIAVIALPIMENRIENKLTQMLDENFPEAQVELKEFDVDVIAGNIDFASLTLKAPNKQIDSLFISNLSIDGVQWLKSNRNNSIEAQNVYLDEIALFRRKSYSDSSDKTLMNIDSINNMINVNQISLNNGNYTLLDSFDATLMSMKNLSLNIAFKGNSLTQLMHGNGSVENLRYVQENGLYTYSIDSATVNIKHNSLHISDLRVSPQLPKDSFSKNVGKRTSRLDLTIPEINIGGFDYRKFLKTGAIQINKAVIDKLDFFIYLNLKMPVDKNRYLSLPHEYLQEVNRTISVDTVQMRSSLIKFETINPKSGKPGHITFNNSFMSIYNITNDSAKITENAEITADFMSQFMKSGKLTGKFRFKLNDKNYPYSLNCHLGKMDIAEANTITIPVINLNVVSGRNNGLDFQLEADKKNYSGSMRWAYKNLNIEVMDRDDNKKKKILSWIANRIFIKSDNIKGKPSFREGIISHERVPYRTFFKNLWEAIESGLATTILGVKRAAQVERMQQNNENH